MSASFNQVMYLHNITKYYNVTVLSDWPVHLNIGVGYFCFTSGNSEELTFVFFQSLQFIVFVIFDAELIKWDQWNSCLPCTVSTVGFLQE